MNVAKIRVHLEKRKTLPLMTDELPNGWHTKVGLIRSLYIWSITI